MLGKRIWKNFIAYEYKELIDNLGKTFDKFKYEYRGGPGKPSVLLGSKENSYMFFIYPREGGKITLKIIEAVADPVTKVAAHLNSSRKYFHGACMVEISPFNDTSVKMMRKVFTYLDGKRDRAFWDLKQHPRFRLAFLLRLRIKQNWVQFLNMK